MYIGRIEGFLTLKLAHEVEEAKKGNYVLVNYICIMYFVLIYRFIRQPVYAVNWTIFTILLFIYFRRKSTTKGERM